MFGNSIEEKVKIISIKENFRGNPTMTMSRNVPLAWASSGYTISFEKEDGTRIHFNAARRKIENLRIGLTGIVKYKNKKFIGFKNLI